jgi:YVTN family beta-propeller protein
MSLTPDGGSATMPSTGAGDASADGTLSPNARPFQVHSSAMAISPDGARLFVAHPDADRVTVLDTSTRAIRAEVALAASPPAVDDAGHYTPAVGPRALAVDGSGATLYVTGERSGHAYAVDIASGKVKADALVCSEPVGVLVSGDGASVFVACSGDDEVLELRAADLSTAGAAPCPRKPWALAWAPDAQTLIATHFLGPGVSTFRTAPLALTATWVLADGPPQGAPEDPTEPHGQVRGLYDSIVRPGTSELWVTHLMLGTDTPQPALDFQRTVFPSITILDGRGAQLARLSVQASPGDGEALGDVVSGPHALAFSDDGALAFVVDTNSEDLLIVDATQRVETQLVRPLPGHMPEAVVSAGAEVYVQERNTEDVAAFRVERGDAGLAVVADGPAFPTLSADPMPADLRLGQHLFYSANSDELPVTQNHWVACASCHLEGRSDAVTWLFSQGPRDTPTNAGGLLDTGFLFRTADRTRVEDYWRTINVEQGGHFAISNAGQAALLGSLAHFVNYAIPAPVAPSTDRAHALTGATLDALRSRGEAIFQAVGCPSCHSGPAKTDSGEGNPTLDLTGPAVSTSTPGGVLLHDVGTCVTSAPFPDVAHDDIVGDPRSGCAFDTPALRGLADSAPYLHNGSAAALEDVIPTMILASTPDGGTPPTLSSDDTAALVEYLRSL